jgi:hypothetical protein
MIIATAETILGAYRPPAMPGENAIGIQHPPSPPPGSFGVHTTTRGG